MTTYTVRIISPSINLDQTLELDEYEHEMLKELIHDVELRVREAARREERIRAATERENDRVRRETAGASSFRGENADYFVVDEPFDMTDFAEAIRRVSNAFSGPTTSSTFNDAYAKATKKTTPPKVKVTPPQPARPRTPHTVQEALAVVRHYAGTTDADTLLPKLAVQRAKRKTHPDIAGGTAEDFHLVTAAEEILRRARHI